MTDKQLLLYDAMVRATLRGQKSMTRRLAESTIWASVGKPYCAVGQRLWVRETHSFSTETIPLGRGSVRNLAGYPRPRIWYAADNDRPAWAECAWRPSIHLPRWACRIELECTAIRLERVQHITEADAIAEGFESPTAPGDGAEARARFWLSWCELYGKESWEANPLVWAISFRRVEGTVAAAG